MHTAIASFGARDTMSTLSHIFMDTVYDYESKLLIVIKMRTSFNRYFEFWRVFYVEFLFP